MSDQRVKLDDELKTAIESEHHLKPTETKEKVLLPSMDDVNKEKTERAIFTAIEACDTRLKPTETVEKNSLPTQVDIESEKNV